MADAQQINADIDCATQLAQVQRELTGLNYAISHDLRAPVRAIAGFSQALKEQASQALDTNAQHYLQRIEQATQRLSVMIDALLGLSRLSQADMQVIAVDVSALCAELSSGLVQQFPQHHPQVHIAPSIKAMCDPHLLRTALRELLHNAWKFSQDRSDAQLHVDATLTQDTLTICVRDNGIGLDMRYADRLFVPFQHLQARAELNGIGIGLASAQRIINRHAGKLWVEAEPDSGAAFYFTLRSA